MKTIILLLFLANHSPENSKLNYYGWSEGELIAVYSCGSGDKSAYLMAINSQGQKNIIHNYGNNDGNYILNHLPLHLKNEENYIIHYFKKLSK